MNPDLSLKFFKQKRVTPIIRTFPDVTLPVTPLRYPPLQNSNMKIKALLLTPCFSKVKRSAGEVLPTVFNSFRIELRFSTFNRVRSPLVTCGNLW
jgi:hypothetical protein